MRLSVAGTFLAALAVTMAIPTPHGDVSAETDSVSVDAISNALYASWGLSAKRDVELTQEQAATVDAISNALYASWGLSAKRNVELAKE
ncbi:hypothetical protein V8F33_006934 [Rhypophila sp. PSN 637]